MGFLAHAPSFSAAPAQGQAQSKCRHPTKSRENSGQTPPALPLLCDFGQVPTPLWALVFSFIVKNQPDLMVYESLSSSDIKQTINQTPKKVLASSATGGEEGSPPGHGQEEPCPRGHLKNLQRGCQAPKESSGQPDCARRECVSNPT